MIVHKHLIVRAEVDKPPMTPEAVESWMRGLVNKIDMKVLSGPHAKYVDVPGNRGVTGVTIIETSHIAMHVWDEQEPGLMQLDVYTCGPFDPQDVFKALNVFEPVKLHWKFLDREHGLLEVKLDGDNS